MTLTQYFIGACITFLLMAACKGWGERIGDPRAATMTLGWALLMSSTWPLTWLLVIGNLIRGWALR